MHTQDDITVVHIPRKRDRSLEERLVAPIQSATDRVHDLRIHVENQPPFLPTMPEQEKQVSDQVLTTVNKHIPEAILAGGTALRFHLERAGKPLYKSSEKVADYDFVLQKPDHDQLRALFAHPSENVTLTHELTSAEEERRKQFIRWVNGDIAHPPEYLHVSRSKDYMSKAKRWVQLRIREKDIQWPEGFSPAKPIIDFYPVEGVTGVEYYKLPEGEQIKVLSPEELLYVRLRDLQQILDRPSASGYTSLGYLGKDMNYLQVLLPLVDIQKMSELWAAKGKSTFKGRYVSWEECVDRLTRQAKPVLESLSLQAEE